MKLETLFLDRDGVINQDSQNYIKSWEEFEFLPGSLEAIARLTAANLRVIVVTNQSALNRGLITRRELERIHDGMRQAVQAHGGRIDDIFFCPHRPNETCGCRKPAPGLILAAREKYDLDLAAGAMVGDSARDVECAIRAGCAHTVLVTAGIHTGQRRKLTARGLAADHVAGSLSDAVDWLLDIEF